MSVSRCLLLSIAVFHFGESDLCKDNIEKKGILEKSLVLYQLERKAEYKELTLKYIKDTTRKKLLTYNLESGEECLNIIPGKYQFNATSTSVVIRNLQKDDEKDYELMLEKKKENEEHVCKIKLKVYEQISNLTLRVREDSQNNTCKVTMRCSMQAGENVTFSWMKDNENLYHDSGMLQISITNDYANSTFRCTAKNPVSEQSSEHRLSSACRPNTDKSHPALLHYVLIPTFLALALLIVAIIVCIKNKYNKGMHTKRCISPANSPQSKPPVPEPVAEPKQDALHTVYAIVQKPKNQSVHSAASKAVPFSSVYELAGPCRADPHLQDISETRV